MYLSLRFAFVGAMALISISCGVSYDSVALSAAGFDLKVISTRPDLVSGGDALVELALPAGVQVDAVTVTLNGKDVSKLFALRENGRVWGRLSGLKLGANELAAAISGGSRRKLAITNYAIGGSLLSGEQAQPWICNTESNGLGAAEDTQCNTAPVYSYSYMPAGGNGQCGGSFASNLPCANTFQAYDPDNPPAPGSVASTTTDTGETVPYIVRVEKGVLNRGVYAIAVLFDPARPWEPWAPQPGWNHKTHIPFGSACEMGHVQTTPPDVMDSQKLGRGFMVFGSELNKYGDHCNDMTSVEAIVMLKEHIVETYGEIRYTIGSGCSGGSHQLHLITSNYPGVIQGALTSCTFQDTWTVGREFIDCALLKRYKDANAGIWNEAEQQAIEGHASTVCDNPGPTGMAVRAPNYFDPTVGTNCAGYEWTYNPATNPTGTRCTLQDFQIGVFGRRAEDGFAKRAYDNVGVQYGLVALQTGALSAEKFVSLNEAVGGYDIDFKPTASRSEADLDAVEIAHRTGRVVHGREMAKVAIIDLMGGLSSSAPSEAEEHYDFRSHVIEARMREANGQADNHVLWKGGDTTDTFGMMDAWLSAIEADRSALPLEQKILADKPANLEDSCFVSGQQQPLDSDVCASAYPHGTDTRVSAGEDWTSDVLKCRLKPLDRAGSDYTGVTFTDAQWTRLQAVFADGTCDYSKPGLFQGRHDAWTTFAAGPGGQPLPAAPVSLPVN